LRSKVLAFVLAAGGLCSVASAQGPGLYGFLAGHAAGERHLERQLDAALSTADLDGWLHQLTAAPNHIGSPHNLENAQFIAERFKSFGWSTRIETFPVLVAYPDSQHFRLLDESGYEAHFNEPPVEGDPDTAVSGALPGMEAYSPDGDVDAPLIYIHQGLSADYEELSRLGLEVKGKIVLVSSGGAGRWVKPRLAESHGAVGIVIFSEPAEDGFVKGDVYPRGAWRTPQTIQRGTLGIDDVLDGEKSGAITESKRLPDLSIPVATIGYGDAAVFLRALAGPAVPPRWQGGLPFTYHVGGGEGVKASLRVHSRWHIQTLYDVIATLKGSEAPDAWIIRGVHHDAWVLGAWDPMAGTTALLAEAQVLGALYRQGIKPKRTLVFASWDGKELGIVGSRAWADKHAAELSRNAVLYLNNDTTSRGYLSVGGNPALSRLVEDASADVVDPETGVSVGERLRARRAVVAAEKNAPSPSPSLVLEPLGTGSDYIAFTHHLGVLSVHTRYGYDRDGDEESVPVYHSLYDSYAHYQRFGDPGLKYINALAQLDLRILLRTANADILPWDYTRAATALQNQIEALQTYNRSLADRARRRNELLDTHAYAQAAVTWRGEAEPARVDADIPLLDLSPLRSASEGFAKKAQTFTAAYEQLGSSGISTAQLRKTNAALNSVEHALLGRGLNGRPWYRHLLQAPSQEEGYDFETLPAIRDAINQHRWDEARAAIDTTAAAVEAAGKELERSRLALASSASLK
jgi:N-acetylated-alpha-linked acidic dipeptidase